MEDLVLEDELLKLKLSFFEGKWRIFQWNKVTKDYQLYDHFAGSTDKATAEEQFEDEFERLLKLKIEITKR